MNFITTYTGVHFNLLSPDEKLIYIEDIAHALSLICRHNGTTSRFYSFAQHAISCANEAHARQKSEKICLACLLYMASNAYISGVKREIFPEYDKISDKIQAAIFRRFGLDTLSESELSEVKDINDSVTYYENCALSIENTMQQVSPMHCPLCFEEQEPKVAERIFLVLSSSNEKRQFVGVTRAKKSWICAVIDSDGGSVTFEKHLAIKTLINSHSFISLLIEMPIGFVKDSSQIRPEIIANHFVSGTFIPMPCRQALYSPLQHMAQENRRVLGKTASTKINYIAAPMIELDSFLQEYPAYKNVICECNSEVCFTRFNSSVLMTKKGVQDGINERMKLLQPYVKAIDDELLEQTALSLKCAKSDLIAALCLAVVSRLHMLGKTKRLPSMPDVDETGLLMQMIIPA